MESIIIIILLVMDCLSNTMLWRRLGELEELKSDIHSVKKTAYNNHDRIMKMEYYSNNK